MKALRFRLYPTPEQEEKMLATVGACRRLWNDALSHRKRRWEQERKPTSYNLQQWVLTAVRNKDPELQQVHSQVAQDVLHRIDRAFSAFFGHRARHPKFKKYSVSGSGSSTYPQAYNGSGFSCGALNKVSLDTREFVCSGCGRVIRRDHNAACVVLKRGIAKVGQDMPQLKPVETGPLLVPTTGRASLVIEAGTRSPRL